MRAAEEQLQSHQHSLAEVEKEVFRIERAAAEKQSRLEILRQLNEEGEGLAKGSQAVLKGLDDPERIRPALAGALVSDLDVDRELHSGAGGGVRSQHARGRLAGCRRWRRRFCGAWSPANLGQAALALPELTRSRATITWSTCPHGAIAWAIDKVDAPATIAPLVRRLLARGRHRGRSRDRLSPEEGTSGPAIRHRRGRIHLHRRRDFWRHRPTLKPSRSSAARS